MEMALIILNQVLMMFILSLVGYLLFKYNKISAEGSKCLGNILIFVSLPCVIINSFLMDFTPEKLVQLMISGVVTLVIMVLGAVISRVICHNNAISAFAETFANPGFFGVPLIVASLSNEAVFYVAWFIVFTNLGQWTYGVSLLQSCDKKGVFLPKKTDAKKAALGEQIAALGKRLIKAPFMVALIIGLFFFLSGIKMPSIPAKAITFLANLNTPIAMFTIGIYMAQTDIAKMFVKLDLYRVSLVRLIIIPAVSLALLSLIPNSYLDMKLALLIVAACPVGSNAAVYAQLYDSDYTYAVETVIISTLICVVTLPATIAIASLVWGF